MQLTPKRLVHYLLERGLLTHSTVVDGELMVSDASSRNRNFKVMCGDEPGFFAKQVKSGDRTGVQLLEREAACYGIAAESDDTDALRGALPELHVHDRPNRILIIELLADAQSLADYQMRGTFHPVDVAVRLGTVLARVHDSDPPAGSAGSHADVFPHELPWILKAHELNKGPFHLSKDANQQVLAIIHQFQDFEAHLTALRDGWRYESLIHGDIKWPNCMIRANGSGDIALIDWETADMGDPGWDVGAVIQAYLVDWVYGTVQQETAPTAVAGGGARFPLDAMRPAAGAFWNAYVSARHVADEGALLRRTVQYAAARMLQTAYEHVQRAPQISGGALRLLQVSLNVLGDPEGAADELLGIAA